MKLEQLASATSFKLLPFDKAQVIGGFVSGTYFLTVSGTAPCLNMQVQLTPLIYVMQPEYWGIEVVGSVKGGICLDAVRPYHVTLPLLGGMGKKGIEVIGGNGQRQRIDVETEALALDQVG
jgi:hypothetical protein